MSVGQHRTHNNSWFLHKNTNTEIPEHKPTETHRDVESELFRKGSGQIRRFHKLPVVAEGGMKNLKANVSC